MWKKIERGRLGEQPGAHNVRTFILVGGLVLSLLLILSAE